MKQYFLRFERVSDFWCIVSVVSNIILKSTWVHVYRTEIVIKIDCYYDPVRTLEQKFPDS